MKRNFLLFLFFITTTCCLPPLLQAQILNQNFDNLKSIEEFEGNPPSVGQVDTINLTPADGLPVFSLGTNGTDKFLLIEKRGAQARYFSKKSGSEFSDFEDLPFLKMQFDMKGISVSASVDEGRVMSIFIGNNFTTNLSPAKKNRWAQLMIFYEGDGRWKIQNIIENVSVAETASFTGEETITVFANNSGELISYLGPNGEEYEMLDNTIEVWIGDLPENRMKQVLVVPGDNANIGEVRFLTWNNSSVDAAFQIDDLLLETIETPPLPVDLLSFNVKQENKYIAVAWQTSWEKNNSHFEVQRSKDGEHFTSIGEVAGQGTSTQLHNYTFADKEGPEQGAAMPYYRLKQVDFDGAFEYSSVRVLMLLHKAFSITEVGPNPFNQQLNIQINSPASEYLQIRLLNSQGQTVLEKSMFMEAGTDEETIQLDNSGKLEAGFYLVEVRSAKSREIIRLLKQ